MGRFPIAAVSFMALRRRIEPNPATFSTFFYKSIVWKIGNNACVTL